MVNPFRNSFNIDLYKSRSVMKWIILVVAIVIGSGSIIYTKRLVDSLKIKERRALDLWTKAIEYVGKADGSELNFISQEIITPENSLPIIIVDSSTNELRGNRNLGLDSINIPKKASDEPIRSIIAKMAGENDPLRMVFGDPTTGEVYEIQYVYYRNSYLLRQLSAYPYVQLTVIAIFGTIAYLAFSYSRTSEQNRVWVGLAKETAHQLGTPLSSLMAWVEYFKTLPELEGQEGIIDELQKDIHRLEMITSRFSNIGSTPVLKDENVHDAIINTVKYLRPRVSSKVSFDVEADAPELTAKMNRPLFEWVVENVCKNGVDAMSGIGRININIGKDSEKTVFIDITDNGKGIQKGKIKDVFKPGFTTKKRGWGLGLTLVKRIIENYHLGRIFVKSSQVDVGTTFRIVLTA